MRLNYTSRDFDSYFDELKTKAQSVFPSWTDFNESNIGTILLELFASIGDQSSFYLNRLVNETFLPTVIKRRNAQKILSRIGYTMAGRVAASVDLTFSFEGGGTHTEDVTIPAGYQVTTEDGEYTFETVQDLTITAGNASGVVSAKQYITKTEYPTFDDSIDQEIFLQEENYLEDSIVLYIAAQLWTEQDDLIDSGASDKHFKVEVADNLRAIMVFGDGTNGLKPTGDGEVTYRAGGGIGANSVQAAKITKLTAAILDALNNPVSMFVTNASSPSGGEDEESVDEARIKGPRSTRASLRTVSRDDYENNSEGVAGIARALALGKNEDGGILTNTTNIYIVPVGGGAPSTALKDAVKDELENEKPVVITTTVNILDAIYKNVTIAGLIIRNTDFSAAAVKTVVDASLTKYFDYENINEENHYTIDFGINGSTLYLSSIINVIMQTTINEIRCVDDVSLTGPAADVALTQKEIPELQTLAGLTVA